MSCQQRRKPKGKREGRRREKREKEDGGLVEQFLNEKGNPSMILQKDDGTWEQIEVKDLIAKMFVPNSFPETHRFVAHKDKNRLNNRADNLYWTDTEPTYK